LREAPLEPFTIPAKLPYTVAPHIYVAIGEGFIDRAEQVLTTNRPKKFNVNPKYFKDCSDAFL